MGSAESKKPISQNTEFPSRTRQRFLPMLSVALWAIRDTRSTRNDLFLLGLSQRQRLLAVMFSAQGEAIRIISARRATRRERRDYEERAE